jgi:hypothetical protein
VTSAVAQNESDTGQQPRRRGRLIQANQIKVDPGAQQAERGHVGHPHRQQQTALTGRVAGERGPARRSASRNAEPT